MAGSGLWKENKLKEFIARDGILATAEEWRSWTIPTIDKLDAVGDAWFLPAAESLIIEDDVFHELVNHPAPDALGSDEFKVAVVALAINNGCTFNAAADNVNPLTGAKLTRNYNDVMKRLKAIQSQLSGACATTLETCFTAEQREMHPLRALRTWKRMSRTFHEIRSKDRGACMTDLQKQASTIPKWDLDSLTQWIKDTEELRQDLLKSGHTELVADDCIVDNLLEALTTAPTSAPYHKEWDHDAWKWKTDHEENASTTWPTLKTRMEGKIKTLSRKQKRSDLTDDKSSKKARVETPAGMALMATESLANAAKSLAAVADKFENQGPPTRTRAQARQQQEQSGKGKKGKATVPQHNAAQAATTGKQTATGEMKKDGAGNVIICDLCNKVGIGLPESNHIVRDCNNLRQNIAKLGGTTMQGQGVQSSKQYVPPAGTSMAHAGILNNGEAMATAMFGPTAVTSFGFTASIDNSLPTFFPSEASDINDARAPTISPHPVFTQTNWFKTMCVILMLLGVASVITTAHAIVMGVSSVLATATTTLTAVLTLPTALMRAPR